MKTFNDNALELLFDSKIYFLVFYREKKIKTLYCANPTSRYANRQCLLTPFDLATLACQYIVIRQRIADMVFVQ